MKAIFTMLALAFTLSAMAFDVTYPVKNFKYISDWDYREEVQNSDKWIVMVFSSNSCLERTIIDNSCFLFERKLDYFVPRFSKNVKVIGFNTYFENYQVVSQFNLRKIPTVIIMKNNQIIKRLEATNAPANWTQQRMSWQDELLKETLEVVSQLH